MVHLRRVGATPVDRSPPVGALDPPAPGQDGAHLCGRRTHKNTRCHFRAAADRVGAVNVKRRYTDAELRERIQAFTPKEKVKAVLLEIYGRSQARTVRTA